MKNDNCETAFDKLSEQDDFVAVLNEINWLYKKGTFENALPSANLPRVRRLPLEKRSDLFSLTQQLKNLLTRNPELARRQNLLRYYEARAIVIEVYDYFNKIDKKESEELIAEGTKLLTSTFLPSATEYPPEERAVLKTKIRFACAGVNELYKKRDYPRAERLAAMLYDFTLESLVKENDPCWGTIGFITYVQGKIYRGLANYSLANAKYAESCEAYHRRAIHKGDDENIQFSKWKAGISLGLGIGFTNLTRGYIDSALQSLIPARTLLLDCGGRFYQSYLDFLIASAKRAYSGNSNRSLLEKSIALLQECETRFDEEHLEVRYRASLELAISYFHIGDDAACQNKLSEVERYAKKRNDQKFLARCLIASSHLARKQGRFEAAKQISQRAIEAAEGFREVLCEARLALGQAEEALEQYDEAYANIESAIKSMQSPGQTRGELFPVNHKILAMCYLSLTRVCLAIHKFGEAEEHFDKWEQIKPQIKHQFVHDFAAEIRERVEGLEKPFVIEPEQVFAADADDLKRKYKFFQELLKEWLLEQAQRRTTKTKGAAELLGISRQAIYNWKNDPSPQTKLKNHRARLTKNDRKHQK
ncbi:MAG: MalT-like region [Blastocatellia bacterium]